MTITVAGGLRLAPPLHDFLVDEALPGTSIAPDELFGALAALVAEFGPRHAASLARRGELQRRIDDWHAARPGPVDADAHTAFLRELGYLVPPPSTTC